jgi:hypothetical protein
MLSAILALLSSSAVGSVIGGLFAWMNRKVDIDAKRLDLLHEQARWAHELAVKDKDLAIANAEADGRERVSIVEGDARIETARMGAIAASQTADQITADELSQAGRLRWLLVLISAFRKAIRPMLTVALLAATLYLNLILIMDFVSSEQLTPEQRFDLQTQAWAWIAGQAAIVISYWFCSRGTVTKN